MGKNGNSGRFYFLGSKIPAGEDCSHEIKRCLLFGRKDMTNLDSVLKNRDIKKKKKKQRHHFADRVWIVKAAVFSSSHVWMWELDYKEGWALKNWCFWTVVLEKTLGSPLGSKEIKLVNPGGNQPWIFTGRINAEAEAPILWPPDAKSRLTRRDPDAGKGWGQEEMGTTEDEMVGWQHRLNEHEKALGVSDGQGSLECRSPWKLQRAGHDLATGQKQCSENTWRYRWSLVGEPLSHLLASGFLSGNQVSLKKQKFLSDPKDTSWAN